MAMDQSALLELLDALKAAGVDERIRLAAQTLYQALIDAEATAVIGAAPWERSRGPGRGPQRHPTTHPDHDGGGSGAADPEAAHRHVLPEPVGAPPADRPGVVRGGDGGLPARGVHPQGR